MLLRIEFKAESSLKAVTSFGTNLNCRNESEVRALQQSLTIVQLLVEVGMHTAYFLNSKLDVV